MKRMRQITEIVAKSEDGEELRLSYSNRGEPYREGCDVELTIVTDNYNPSVSVFLEHFELVQLRDAINKLLGDEPQVEKVKKAKNPIEIKKSAFNSKKKAKQ